MAAVSRGCLALFVSAGRAMCRRRAPSRGASSLPPCLSPPPHGECCGGAGRDPAVAREAGEGAGWGEAGGG